MDILTILQLLLALAAVALVLYLSYALSKYMANKINHISNSNNIRIIERVSLTQDKGLAVVEISRHYYLVGFSTNTIEILQELQEADLHFPDQTSKPNFLDILNSQIKSRLDLKIGAKEKRKTDGSGETDEDKKEK